MAGNPNTKIASANAGLTARHRNGQLDWTGVVRYVPERLLLPLHWRTPRRVFVNSLSDMFHPDVKAEWIIDMLAVMALAQQHTFQILTKRPERMRETLTGEHFDWDVWLRARHIAVEQWGVTALDRWPTPVAGDRRVTPWPLPNVWCGTSIENQATADERIPHLLATPAAVRWLSVEPQVGPITLDGYLWEDAGPAWAGRNRADPGIDWLVQGGESGTGARPAHPDWFRALRDQCLAAGVAYHFKQWGAHAPLVGRALTDVKRPLVAVTPDGHVLKPDDPVQAGAALMVRVGKKAAGRLLDDREWNEYPSAKEYAHA